MGIGNESVAAVVRPAEDLAALAARINAEHEAGEAASRKGLEHYRRAGEWLTRAKSQVGHGNWLKWVAKNVTFSERRAQRYMDFAKSDVTSDLAEQEAVWRRISGNLPAQPADAEPDAQDVEEAAAPDQKTPHVAQNTGEVEWYTPPEYLEAARAVLGAIDLDPASSHVAQKTVGAGTYYTKDDDGLAHDWRGRVWLNPPYARHLIGPFVAKLVEHFRRGDVGRALVLTNNGTDTQWFHLLAGAASAICLLEGRVRFLDPEGNLGKPLQGQAIVYLGPDPSCFVRHFEQFGLMFTSCKRRTEGFGVRR